MTQAAACKIVGRSWSTWKRWRADGTIPPGVCIRGPRGRTMVCDSAFWGWWRTFTSPPLLTRKVSLEAQLFSWRKP